MIYALWYTSIGYKYKSTHDVGYMFKCAYNMNLCLYCLSWDCDRHTQIEICVLWDQQNLVDRSEQRGFHLMKYGSLHRCRCALGRIQLLHIGHTAIYALVYMHIGYICRNRYKCPIYNKP